MHLVRISEKGQGNTFWIIIGAVIALVVLIVLLLIFTGKTEKVGGGFLDCGSKGGKCVPENGCLANNNCKEQCGEGYTYSSAFSCEEKDGLKQICCLGTETK